MNPPIKKPRCFLVYALASEGMLPSDANRVFNDFVGDRSLPLVIFHDHFIGKPGGVAVFYCATAEEREALYASKHLEGWNVDIRPLIFSYSPAALDEQIEYTLRAYRGEDWSKLREEKRPSYGDPRAEAETAAEE
ncbi:MAG: hypothetical protein Q8896_10600 [Bacteroidota bacterium]|nr:hypothetical protein [Bacteroidota bacterium]MDP4234883.1 hypothetical protein [Bacteroidota bacterium]